ncbi:ZapG family protein [Candidatus Gillettellia adelgis]
MTWEYTLIGLVVGIIMSTIVMRFRYRKLRHQHVLQRDLDNKKTELGKYHKELLDHFAYSVEFLDSIAQDYRKLYQHMEKRSNGWPIDFPNQKHSSCYQLRETESDKNKLSVEIPRDYSEGSSDLLYGKKIT